MRPIDVVSAIFEYAEERFQELDDEHHPALLIDLLCREVIQLNEKLVITKKELEFLKKIRDQECKQK